MPNLVTAKGLIRQRFAGLGLVTPNLIAYDNAKFRKPSPSVTWIRFIILVAGSDLIEIGGVRKKTRHSGIFTAQLFGPQEEGDGGLDALYQTIFDNFSSKSFDGVTYRTVDQRSIGVSDAWWQVNVICPWQADYLHT